MKNKTLKTSLLLLVLAIFSTNLSFSQVVFSENFNASGCITPLNAFHDGCLPGWISTSGTPSVAAVPFITPFSGRYGHCNVKYDGFCTNGPSRSEGIAINHNFIAGQQYKISYQVLGSININPYHHHTAEWILANGLTNQTAQSSPLCYPGEVTPPIPGGSQQINSGNPINFNESSWTYNSHTFTATANFNYIWFRNATSTTGAWNTQFGGSMFIDDVVIEKICPRIITDDQYYSCGEDFPTICPIGTDANTTWAYNAGTVMTLVHTGPCYTPTQAGMYVLVNSSECFATATLNIVDTCAPCNADFQILTNSQGNGMSAVVLQLTDPNVSITYMELIQNGQIISSGPPVSFVLPSGFYTICIVARNNETGQECESCQDFCLGDGETDFEWNGIERAREWRSESTESSVDDKNQTDVIKGKQLEEDLKPIITPNPSNGTFVVSSLNTKVGMTAIEVYNMNSKLVYSLNSVQNQNRISVDLKDKQSGIYIIKVMYSDGSVRQQKVVVTK